MRKKHALRLITISLYFLVFSAPVFGGEMEKEELYSPTEVDGLFFDVDEGVKIRKGPGGSVYVESNREFMQRKFKKIEERFEEIEERFERLESVLAEVGGEEMAAKLDPDYKDPEDIIPEEPLNRVLATT